MDSEFRNYGYISEVLRDLGWDTRNPSRGGDVYTQGEFRKHDTLLTEALGKETPENIVRILWEDSLRYWVVEAKSGGHKKLELGVQEAKKYADEVNQHANKGLACFATGIAGSPDDTFLVETHYWNGKGWQCVKINDYETTGFLSRLQCLDILASNKARLNQFDSDPDRFLKKANAINKTLHDNGIAVGDRAKVMGAILLALADDEPLHITQDARKVVQAVNGNIEHILRTHGKEDFAETIRLVLPATENNHLGYRKAIVETIQHLREMNVRSAINGSDDALGKFYETFLKYANGAKEMGIVLTPRHITKFGIEALGVEPHDKVFDPTCGTGGFLVAAMDHVRQSRATDAQFEEFKTDGIWGVEKEDPVYGLALVNMIFRGDGKSGLQDGNCFDYEFWQRDGKTFYQKAQNGKKLDGAKRPFSRVFMNPPFKTKIDETKFVDYALKQMKERGLLFAVLPAINIGGHRFAEWRKHLLERHTVKAVIKFDKNLFYPVQEGTYGLIIEAHEPHKDKKAFFMGILFDDKHRPRRSKMLSVRDERDNVERMTSELRNFLLGGSVKKESLEREQLIASLKIDDNYTFSPETYISSSQPETLDGVMARGIDLIAAKMRVSIAGEQKIRSNSEVKEFPLCEFIDKIIHPTLQSLKNYPSGAIPAISATAENNGIAEWLEIPNELLLRESISISKTHNTKPCQAFWHPYDFAAINTVHLIRPIAELKENEAAILYLCEAISAANAWRYDYARPVDLKEITVFLPVDEKGQPDYKIMSREAKCLLDKIPSPPHFIS